MRIIFTLLLLGFVVPGVAQKKAAKRALQQLMEKHQAVGLSVAVVKNGKIHYTDALGFSNKQKATKLKPSHQFRIASISKSFTATGLMQLVAAGKIALDDDVSDLIGFEVRNPTFPETTITLKMLLSHTSSLNDSKGYFTLDSINPKTRSSDECYSNYAPGTDYKYCNLNYNMAGAILEKWSGERFDAYIPAHILTPLGIDGGYNTDLLDTTRLATLYEYDASNKVFIPQNAYVSRKAELQAYTIGYSTPLFSPTGGLKVSAPDLARYMMMHMHNGRYDKGQIISAATAKLMQTPVAIDEGYGLGLIKTDKYIPGKVMIGHTGSAYGLSSQMFFCPEEEFGFVLITNGCDSEYNADGYVTLLQDAALVLYNLFIK